MPSVQTAHIVYFSGTGGTARVAEGFRAALDARGVRPVVTELDSKPKTPVQADLLVLLYPVYAANAPQPIGEWLATAPLGEGRPAVVVSVSGGGEVSPNTACRVRPIRMLQRRGYRVVWDEMLVMPSNFLMPYGDALSALLLAQARPRAERIAEGVLAGQTRRATPLLWDRLLTHLMVLEHVGSRYFGRHLRADDRCTNCGWCAGHCPCDNITLVEGRPVFGDRCVLCTRCVYGCPARAIVPGLGKFAIIREGFDLSAVEKRTAGQTEFPPVEELTKGAAYSGVRKYLQER